MNFLRKLFGNKPAGTHQKLDDLGLLKTDLHSHLIPGIDDGAQTLDESLEMIRALMELGYRKIITTPHVMKDGYPNSKETILNGMKALREAIAKEVLDVAFEAGAEYYLDEHFLELIDRKELLTFGDGHVLFELSFYYEPISLHDTVFRMQSEGYRPILAHVERYGYLHAQPEKLERLRQAGLLFQININSLSPGYASELRKNSEKLLRDGMVDYLGSDAHSMRSIDMMRQALGHPLLVDFILSGKCKNAQL